MTANSGSTDLTKTEDMERKAALPVLTAGEDGDDHDQGGAGRPGVGTVVKAKPKTKKPSMYRVLLLNDDYTPMEFVVGVLQKFFGKSREQATQIMLKVHREGRGICGVYPKDVAASKVNLVTEFTKQHQHPLQCCMEEI